MLFQKDQDYNYSVLIHCIITILNDCWAFGIFLHLNISSMHPFYSDLEIECLKTEINTCIKDILEKTILPTSEVETAAQKLMRQHNIKSLAILYNETTQQAINDKVIYLYLKTNIKNHMEGNYTRVPFDEKDLEVITSYDPDGFFRNLISRCLNPNKTTRITMAEIILLLENPPNNYK